MPVKTPSAGSLGQQAGKFVRHVLPAAFKPIHSLWHEILGFLFLSIAAGIIWRVVRSAPGSIELPLLLLLIVFVVILLIYGVSSIRKSRKITRS